MKLFSKPGRLWVLAIILWCPLATFSQEKNKLFTANIPAGTLAGSIQYLSRLTGTVFTYNPEELAHVKVAARNVTQQSVRQILHVILEGSGFTYIHNSNGYIIHATKGTVAAEKSAAAIPVLFRGKVIDEKGRALEFASVLLKETGAQQTTDYNGIFVFRIPDGSVSSHISISYVGKQTIETVLTPDIYLRQPTFQLKELSLTLEGIHVNAIQKGTNSSSSIVFDREMIEQSQAFSLADIMNMLPGREVKVPDMLNVQSLTLRTAALNNAAMINSMGTAIIVDDIARSNDANMQAKSLSMFGNSTSTLRVSGKNSFDVPFQGQDLRDIPLNNVERIEVISGIPSAKYGNVTSGAVIIDRQAGATPFQARVGIIGYTTQYSLSKGIKLGEKLGAMNFSINHLRSNADPRSLLQSYNRTTLDLMWTERFSSKLKNTISLTYGYRNDNIKMDPEDTREQRLYSKSNSLILTDRISYNVGKKWLQDIRLSMGFTKARQESYSQFAMNGDPKPIGDKDTTGVYEGYYIPGTYMAVDHVLGRPSTANASLNLNGNIRWLGMDHQWSGGASMDYTANNGEGVIVDPNTPRFVNQRYQNQRPYSYEYLPATVNTGIYLQDHVELFPFGHKLTLDPGLRYDMQNGWGILQPRINTAYAISEKLTTTLSYGVSSKSPPMSYRYPAPSYFDLPVLDVYNEDPAKRIYLVYTEKVAHDNSYLKPMKAMQLEGGLKYTDRLFSGSLFAFYKMNRDGFNVSSSMRKFMLPAYDYVIEDGKLRYWPTGKSQLKVGLFDNVAANDISTDDMGLDLLLSTAKVPAIATSFSLSSFLYYSRYGSSLLKYSFKDASQLVTNGIWYGVFAPLNYQSWAMNSRLNTSTHIPKLGFIVNLTANFAIYKRQRNIGNSGQPLGYVDINSIYHDISELAADSPIRQALGLYDLSASDNSDPYYMSISMQVIKEIKKKIKFSVNAYNIFNILNKKYSDISKTVRELTQPVVLSGEISFKF
ncbi:outer membrane receptor protein involved in Fe transport [Chitinophaga dinghuensis]|uniref:Outer membrane receptor protein involved in Fe transport n=1 Tax=Chitinophaga dinghuensis TaxID=1539050 RepID=A0A327VZ00_9BACT|nr:TonB-dependent receptor [Chitinophaga dinghuensis]RAJ82209.1 outer membrane receptor protein involved in Fe transport [Chitinophaga dinghuensis]